MPQRDPDGTWNWGPLEGTGRGLMAGVRDGLGRAFGSIGPNDGSTFRGRMGNIIANEINPLTGAATLGAMANARNAAIAGNDMGPRAATVQNPVRVSPSPTRNTSGSVVARGFAGAATRPMSNRAEGFRAGLMRDSTGVVGPGRGRAGTMPVDPYTPQGVPTGPGSVSRPTAAGSGSLGADDGNSGNIRLGLGQLGRGGDEALNAANRSFYNRRGSQAEM